MQNEHVDDVSLHRYMYIHRYMYMHMYSEVIICYSCNRGSLKLALNNWGYSGYSANLIIQIPLSSD